MPDNWAEVEVKGLKELERGLLRLDQATGYKVLRSALFKATKSMLDRAKRNAQRVRDSGATAASLGRRSRRGTARGTRDPRRAVTIELGTRYRNKRALRLWNARNPRKRPAKSLIHPIFVEFGSVRQKADPFLGPAARSTASRVVRDFAANLRKLLGSLVK